MATATVNGVRLAYEISGSEEIPLVLVHGSWVDRRSWDLVVPRLAERFRVVTYDRRGHSESERPSGQGSVREDVADLAALIEYLGLAPAWVAANSFGASISLRLTVERPDLLRGFIGHEPPLFALLALDPATAPLLAEIGQRAAAVGERIASGDHESGARLFVETVAIGPGGWNVLSSEDREVLIRNALTFLDETRDPEGVTIDLESARAFTGPRLLTMGDQSPPLFAPVVRQIADRLPEVKVVTFAGAGHIPHQTHPQAYADEVIAFAGA